MEIATGYPSAPGETPTLTKGVPVVMIRHAQSLWNRENRFTGWADPPLTGVGIRQAMLAGGCLRYHGHRFDVACSSRLQRSVWTTDLLLTELGQRDIVHRQDWRLNERHYGALQGLNKGHVEQSVGREQVARWRRGYHDLADPLPENAPEHPLQDARYADIDAACLPSVESLADTRERVTGFWVECVQPLIRQHRRVLISAHGNTLRALIMALSGMTVNQVEQFEIPVAVPIIYSFSGDGTALRWRYLEPGCNELLSA